MRPAVVHTVALIESAVYVMAFGKTINACQVGLYHF